MNHQKIMSNFVFPVITTLAVSLFHPNSLHATPPSLVNQTVMSIPQGPSVTGNPYDTLPAITGDFNGDGTMDLVVCYNNFVSSASDGLGIFTAQPSRGDTYADADIIMEGAGGFYGLSCANAGDVNGDGYDDILVGSPSDSDAGNNAGAAFLILSSTGVAGNMLLTSNSLSAAIKYTGENEEDQAGKSVAAAGDVNDDGYADFVVGAHLNDTAASDAGVAYLVLGSANPASASLSTAIQFTGTNSKHYAGYSVAGAGDVNQDGYDDLLVGAIDSPYTSFSSAAYLILGSASPASASLSTAIQFAAEDQSDYAGFSVAPAGDVNRDGYDDFLIGAPYNGDSFGSAGAAYLVLGSASPASASLSTAIQFMGKAQSDLAGYTVAPAGDVNRDGYDDFLIGAPYNDDGGNTAGAVYLVHGRSNFSKSTHTLPVAMGNYLLGNTAELRLGDFVGPAGDYTGDNKDDIIMSGRGEFTSVNAQLWVITNSSTSYTTHTVR